MATYVGLDPRTDIRWVTHPQAEAMRLLAEGKIDASAIPTDQGIGWYTGRDFLGHRHGSGDDRHTATGRQT